MRHELAILVMHTIDNFVNGFAFSIDVRDLPRDHECERAVGGIFARGQSQIF